MATSDTVEQWQAESGQLLMDFEPEEAGAAYVFLHRPVHRSEHLVPDRLQAGEPGAWRSGAGATAVRSRADGSYLQTLSQPGVHALRRRPLRKAVALYRCGLAHLPDEPLMHFNLAVALEDDGLQAEALASYGACIELAPEFADAHFNAARLYAEAGDDMRAIRHFNAYRKLQPR
ncbi:tetratricopeptide repeat protein [Cupriavidus basilensis]